MNIKIMIMAGSLFACHNKAANRVNYSYLLFGKSTEKDQPQYLGVGFSNLLSLSTVDT